MDYLSLSPLELKFLEEIKKLGKKKVYLSQLSISQVEATRAAEFLENKSFGKVGFDEISIVKLSDKGKVVRDSGLPEKKIVEFLKSNNNVAINEIPIDNSELKPALGALKRKGAIEFTKDKPPRIKLIQEPKFPEEQVFELFKSDEIDYSTLTDFQKEIVKQLEKRRLLKIEKRKKWWFELSVEPKKLEIKETIDKVDKDVIENELWKKKEFRKYDLVSDVPKISGGRSHFITEIINKISDIWVEMGFKEMEGNDILPSFWDLDALFVPQDHPARTMQDSFYIRDQSKNRVAKLPINESEMINVIKSVHENGWKTGSTGWQQEWSEDKAKEMMLRTHTTALSVLTLYRLKKQGIKKGKFFTIDKAFRNETLDWKHLFEFNQVEGIVVGDVNFKNLLYYLKIFYKKLGFDKIKIIPSYFPYTEPSAEVHVWSESRKEWVELGGSGIFRAEVVEPFLGKGVNVLAWGLGLERIIIMKYGIKDIREIYANDVSFLKSREIF